MLRQEEQYEEGGIKEHFATFCQLTYCRAEKFLPVRFEIENHTPPGPWQSGPTDKQHQEDQIGKGRSHPNHLKQNNKEFILLLMKSCSVTVLMLKYDFMQINTCGM